MAAGLHKIGKAIERGDVNAPKAVVVLTLDVDGVPNGWVWTAGAPTLTSKDEMRQLMHLASYEIVPMRVRPVGQDDDRTPTTFDQRLKAAHARRVAWDGVAAAKKAEEANAAPWQCEHCGKRYKTERGAVAHERTCLSAPNGAEHRWTSGYTVAGGWVLACRCGWITPPNHHRPSVNAAMRAHMNEHAPKVLPGSFGLAGAS